MPIYLNTYADRAKNHTNPAAKDLLEVIERKQSNLCISVDVTSSKDFLNIIDTVGPYVSLIKANFEPSLIPRLQDLSIKHDFLIFEDRKFADIGTLSTFQGNTVALQYSAGVHKIATCPGPSVIKGLATVGLPLGRGLLLLAEMSTAGALARGVYTEDAVRMARAARDFVVGFIAQHRMEGRDRGFFDFDPGVGLDTIGDGLGQQYRTPEQVILESGCDIIIVGRGIYGKVGNMDTGEVQRQAERYRNAGWDAYLQRLKCLRV
ncbi:orotidine-5'-monophosphate decarboxylase [Multifurca ochricompacta]|uniref:Orotidine 5'-phosphate decarboxylase n=1 Tax=Multifurca ochricompacta TaxID=376703 RepID=A0AAD4ME25_9AGAM|nr:orotidine-5'-monophosphate decarboxylase [Multifurca ochricompacta]